MIEIKGYAGYFIADDGKTVIGKQGHALKPHNNCVVLSQDGMRTVVPVNKLLYCAQKGVSPDEIAKGYSFRDMGNGKIEAETFGQRMSYVIKKGMNKVKISDEQIDFLMTYLQLVKNVHNEVTDAKTQLYWHIYNDRKDYIRYAFKIGGNINQETAEMFADDAILATMEAICNFHRMITNPRGCVRTFIRGYVKENRKILKTPIENSKNI